MQHKRFSHASLTHNQNFYTSVLKFGRSGILALFLACLLVVLYRTLKIEAYRDGFGSDDQQQIAKLAKRCPSHTQIISTVAQGIHPQLSEAQLAWIYWTLSSLGSATSMLVFGLGFDSPIWAKANCMGRTVYLEDSSEWIQNVKQSLPETAEVYQVKYKGTVDKAAEFFHEPWLMEAPEHVSNDCFSIILIDAPAGFQSYQPGRMEAAYFSVDLTLKCLRDMKLDKVHIFLHDVGRHVEQAIIQEYFVSRPGVTVQPHDIVGGPWGQLAGFVLTLSKPE